MAKKTRKTPWGLLKSYLSRVFIDGLSGMALGLFSTLIVGTMLKQLGAYIPGQIGTMLSNVGAVAQVATGAGIGCGVAVKLGHSRTRCPCYAFGNTAVSVFLIRAIKTEYLKGAFIGLVKFYIFHIIFPRLSLYTSLYHSVRCMSIDFRMFA